jgi:hypothetical protein
MLTVYLICCLCFSLHQRGGKTLKDRTRFVQVEARLDELSKSIGRTRRELAQKPH